MLVLIPRREVIENASYSECSPFSPTPSSSSRPSQHRTPCEHQRAEPFHDHVRTVAVRTAQIAFVVSPMPTKTLSPSGLLPCLSTTCDQPKMYRMLNCRDIVGVERRGYTGIRSAFAVGSAATADQRGLAHRHSKLQRRRARHEVVAHLVAHVTPITRSRRGCRGERQRTCRAHALVAHSSSLKPG